MTNLKNFLSQQQKHNDQTWIKPGESTESSETADYYRVLIRLLTDYTYIVSLEPESIVVEWVGESLAHATEYTHEELMCPGCWEKLIHPDDLPLLKGEQYHLTRLADSTVCEFRIVTKSGEVRWLVHHSSPIWDEKHDHIVKIIGAASDITERKRAEVALKEKQRFIERVAEASPNILYVDDLVEGRNIYINPQITAILGYRPDELPRLQAERFRSIWPPNTESIDAQWHRRLQDAQDGEVVEGEYQVRHANGEWRWLRSHSIVFTRTPNGAPHQILGTAQDITERKVAEEKLTQRTLELATLSQKLVRAQEDERRNIARELHDEIGQLLTGLSLTLETSKHLPPDKAKAKIDEGTIAAQYVDRPGAESVAQFATCRFRSSWPRSGAPAPFRALYNHHRDSHQLSSYGCWAALPHGDRNDRLPRCPGSIDQCCTSCGGWFGFCRSLGTSRTTTDTGGRPGYWF
jgi:PAS domain S-box-containing protein